MDGDAVLRLLTVPEKGDARKLEHHAGNSVTQDLKEVTTMARLVGVHITPTVIFDGVVQSQISSEWTGEQWLGWLRSVVSAG